MKTTTYFGLELTMMRLWGNGSDDATRQHSLGHASRQLPFGPVFELNRQKRIQLEFDDSETHNADA